MFVGNKLCAELEQRNGYLQRYLVRYSFCASSSFNFAHKMTTAAIYLRSR